MSLYFAEHHAYIIYGTLAAEHRECAFRIQSIKYVYRAGKKTRNNNNNITDRIDVRARSRNEYAVRRIRLQKRFIHCV